MSDTLYRINTRSVCSPRYRIIWCSKYRCEFLTGKIADELHLLPLKKVQELDVMIKALKIIPSHVHLFIENNQTEAFYHPANHFKDYISRMSHFEFLQQRSRLPSIWSRSYHVDPIGYVSDETVKYYIKMQKKRVNL